MVTIGLAAPKPKQITAGIKPYLTYLNSGLIGLALAIALGLFITAIYRTAWLSDDSFITFRVVVNLWDGLGPVWWPGERVQVFTHPLWFGILSLAYGITREIFITTAAISIFCGGVAYALLYNKTRPWQGVAAIIAGLSSPSLIDFTTSGLENPLNYLLLALLYISLPRLDEVNTRKSLIPFLCAALLILNRLDTIAFLVPTFLGYTKRFSRRHIRYLLLAFSPLMAWMIFATIYYGSPLPNTYYAKLSGGMPFLEYTERAIRYYKNVLSYDPGGAVIIIFGILLGILGDRRSTAFSFGILGHLLYLFPVGGDFMAGRFFTPPIFAALLIVSGQASRLLVIRQITLSGLWVFIVMLFNQSMLPFIFTNYCEKERLNPTGIVNERKFYLDQTIFSFGNLRSWPNVASFSDWDDRNTHESLTVACGGLGKLGLFAFDKSKPIDSCGLADAFMARVPANRQHGKWRIAHLVRNVPIGYLRSIVDQKNHFVSKDMSDLYDDVLLVTQGSIWSSNRWGAIWRLNTKTYIGGSEHESFMHDKLNLLKFKITRENIIRYY